MFRSLFFSASILLLAMAAPTWGQSSPIESSVTPRQIYTSFVSGIPVPDLRYKPFEPQDYVSINEAPALRNALPPLLQPGEEEAEDQSATKEALPEPPQDSFIQTDNSSSQNNLPLAFFISAADYLKARSGGSETQLVLNYTISVASAKSGLKVPPRTLELIIGPDYASVKKGESTEIFDFKTNRLLRFEVAGETPFFSNVSLYPAAYKAYNTVKTSTKDGRLDQITIGPNAALDAFWLESSMGWAARSSFPDLKVKREGQEISSSYKGKIPFAASLTGPEFPSSAHMRVLMSYWLHDIPIHPAILPQIGRPDRAPKSLQILTFSPKFPDGLVSDWTLTKSEIRNAPFPLDSNLKNSLEAKQGTALSYIISGAIKGNPVTPKRSDRELKEDIRREREAGNSYAEWLISQDLAARQGGCEKTSIPLCNDIKALEAAQKSNSEIAQLSGIIKDIDKPRSRLTAFEALFPYIKDGTAPAFLVKKAGQARSKIRTNSIKSEALKSVRADHLLEQALMKNPEDPEVFLNLAQVYAAQGRFAESWDLQDALRRLPGVPEKLTNPINTVETTLREVAPGFFITKVP